MKSEVKKLNDSKFEVTCQVDEKVWVDAQNKAHKKAYEKVEVKGFRKGHVPEDIARKHVNEGEILNDAINIVLPDAFTKAMEENKLRPFLRPQVNVEKFSTSELSLKFTVVVMPKVTLGKYKGIKVEKTVKPVTDQDIDEDIKKLLEQNAELIVKDGEAKKGDTVVLDFEGFVDGKPFEGGKASNYELALGSGQFIPGFEDQLIGLKANDKKDVNVTFPENYVENLKGKKATFKCVIHEVKEKKIPELKDENIKDLEIAGAKTVAELKKVRQEALVKKNENEADNKAYNDLVDKIVADAKVVVAEEIIAEEAKAMKENMQKQIEQNGLKWNQYLQILGQKEEDFDKKTKVDAEKNIRSMLVINEIAVTEKISVTPDDIKKEQEKLAKLYNLDIKKVEEIFKKNLDEFANQIRSRKLHDFLMDANK